MVRQVSDKKTMNQNLEKQGFTLIELSIVLVIIGLIVGGVLVGQDLIKAAEIRATVSQMEKYNAAANTFRNKYNGLPGDLVNAANFGFVAAGGTNQGNGLIESGTAGDGTKFGFETAAFWNQLAVANLIPDNIGSTENAAYVATTWATTFAPQAKLGGGNYILMSGFGTADTLINGIKPNYNYFVITAPSTAASSIASGVMTVAAKLSPSQSFQIDTKLDDGVPTTGIVEALDGTTFVAGGLTLSSAASGACQNAGVYNSNTTDGAKPLCSLVVRTSF